MKCKLCGHVENNQGYDVREMMFGYRDLFRYFQCAQCEVLQLEDPPRDVSRYYPEHYYSYKPADSKNRIAAWLRKQRDGYALFGDGIFGKLLYTGSPRTDLQSLRALPIRRDSRILDVGCGSGDLLYALCNLGFGKLLGVDPYLEQDLRYENGLRIQKRDIHEVEGPWDLIMLHHAFEHIADPVKTMNTISRLLAPKGHCVIRIPTVSSYAWTHYGVHWVQLDAPRHLFLHSVKSMQILAEQAGLEVWKRSYDSTAFQFWGSEQYLRDIALHDERSYLVNPRSSLFSRSDLSVYKKQANTLNASEQGDQAVFYLRKKSNASRVPRAVSAH